MFGAQQARPSLERRDYVEEVAIEVEEKQIQGLQRLGLWARVSVASDYSIELRKDSGDPQPVGVVLLIW